MPPAGCVQCAAFCPLDLRFRVKRGTPIHRLNTTHIPPLFFAACGLLLGLLLCAAVLRTVERGQEQMLIGDYGQSMANLAAKRAVDATLNHDLVSLQVIVQDVADNPRTLLASIHDVENQLLVQSGNTHALNAADAPRSFSAPIPLQDSIAGYVSVHIESQMPEIKPLYYSFAGLCTLLVLVAILSLLNAPGPWLYTPEVKPAPTEEPPVDETAPAEAPAPLFTAYLCWQWQNLATLRQQISAERLEQLFNRVELILVEAVKLTDAQCQTRRNQGRMNGEYWITYASPDSMVAYYQLMVCAHLIHQLLAPEVKLKLVYSSTLTASAEIPPSHTPVEYPNHVICLLPEGIDEEWDDWIYYNELPTGLQLMGFLPPLDDQIQELLTQLRDTVELRTA